ncbi:MAG: hypothetical protein IT324_27130, partial [Anaerolineae bacterium]|nr:hypothetical protein [Anaerolineae bacterium]
MKLSSKVGSSNVTLVLRIVFVCLMLALALVLLSSHQSASAAPDTAAPTPVKRGRIHDENQKPGTTKWKSPKFSQYLQRLKNEEALVRSRRKGSYADRGADPQQTTWQDTQIVKGYASKASINVGESITFHISSTGGAAYNLDVYRMGWYNGDGGRWVAGAQNLPGHDYGVPAPDPATGMIAANWPVAYTLQTNTTWVSGVYLVWLSPVGSNTVSYIIFVVRDDSRTSDILYQVALTTYQAYNAWGGKSLYDYNSIGGRATKVSFDRPYDHDDGSGLYFSGDYNMVRWIEQQGYDVTYATSVDMETNPNLLANHKVFLSNFHDEYWSKTMRDNLTAARDQGKHLAFFTSNNIYWQIRFENSASGAPNRVIVCYKNVAADPMSSSSTPWLTTVLWRDAIVNRPENELLGVMFQDAMGFGDYYPWVVTNADHWFYQGTGLNNGDTIDKLVGYEFDRVFNNGKTPANLVMLSNSPIGSPYDSVANAALYTAPSGAIVFDAATNYWAYMLDGNWIWPVDARVQRMTNNLLGKMLGTFTASTPTFTPTGTLPTNTPTRTPSNTPTSTPTHTATGTQTSTPVPANLTFYRAINFNGPALTIDNNTWEGSTAPNYTTNGYGTCDQTSVLIPSTDANRATMLRCAIVQNGLTVTMRNVPNGTYDVSFYVWENDWPQIYSLYLQGQLVVDNYNSVSGGHWAHLGPWTVSVTDGTINLTSTGWVSNLSGMEVWSRNTATTGTPTSTPTPSNTPLVTGTPTTTPTNTRTSTPSNTPTNTLTSTPTATLSSGSTFYRAINLAGTALTIDGNNWEADAAPNFTTSGTTATCATWLAPNPATDANRTKMIQCYRYGWNTTLTMSAVPNGTYSVYLYTFEDWQS